MGFDPIRERDSYTDFMIDFMERQAFDLAKPMGNIGARFIANCFNMHLFGLGQRARPFIARAIEWVDGALARHEVIATDGENFYSSNLVHGKALGLWLLDNDQATAVWETACDWHWAASREPGIWAKKDLPTWFLDEHLATCILAGNYAAGTKEFEFYHGKVRIDLQKSVSPRAIGYAICCNAAGGDYDPELIDAAGRRMLKAKAERWLIEADTMMLAKWLMIVLWLKDRTVAPQQIILQTYDFLDCVPADVKVEIRSGAAAAQS